MISTIKDLLVFLFIYVPPLVIFIKFSREKNRSKILLILISLAYIILSVFTNNLLPFVLVVFDIKYLKDANKTSNSPECNSSEYSSKQSFTKTISNKLSNDFIRFGFNMRKFNIFSALKLTFFSYFITIIILIIETFVFSRFKVQVKEQEVVTWMSNMPLTRFIILIPILIIFAPVLEEFVFRWLIFEKIFKHRIGIYLSALVSSMIFAFIHFNLRAFPLLIWIGLYNCYLIEKKGYWYSVFNHFTFNFITTIALLVQKLTIMKT
jgi:membrane protease YdiL (CAAX protease family)